MEQDKHFRFVVPAGKEKERLDKYLTRNLSLVSRARIQKVIVEGKVLVDGKVARSSHLVLPNENIEICIPKPRKIDILPENIPLNILHEDEHLLVLNKDAGLVVHPAFANYTGTLVNALLYHCGDLSSIGGKQRPGIVHRLDKETSGLMVVAKDDVTHRELSRQFAAKTAQREYHAVAWGHFKKKRGRIETDIARSPKDRTKMTVQTVGKLAITEYELLAEFRLLSFVRLKLRTGRTHQIRVHLSYIGHPVFGDMTYGGRNRQLGRLTKPDREFASSLLEIMARQALHAKTLGFIHPITQDFLQFDSDLPPDMKHLLDRLRNL